MRTRLKGINSKRKRLADGRIVTYYYAWKGGPRLPGKPGSPEFVAAFAEAHKQQRPVGSGTLLALLNAYQKSADFTGLAAKTRADYVKIIRRIEARFGSFPITGLKDRRARSIFLTWRDDLATDGKTRSADYTITVLAAILSWSQKRGLIDANPIEKPGRLHQTTRAEKTWSKDDEARFLAAAPPHLHLPFILALWTGQRQGDLLRLTWGAYDGESLHLRQQKTGVRVTIPVATQVKALLDPLRGADDAPILLTSRGTAWTESGFRASWRKACEDAGIAGLTFHDLRGTCVTRLAMAEATQAEIATLTGHSLADVRDILDAHYLARDPALAKAAIRKLEALYISPTGLPTKPQAHTDNSVKT